MFKKLFLLIIAGRRVGSGSGSGPNPDTVSSDTDLMIRIRTKIFRIRNTAEKYCRKSLKEAKSGVIKQTWLSEKLLKVLYSFFFLSFFYEIKAPWPALQKASCFTYHWPRPLQICGQLLVNNLNNCSFFASYFILIYFCFLMLNLWVN